MTKQPPKALRIKGPACYGHKEAYAMSADLPGMETMNFLDVIFVLTSKLQIK